MEFSGQKRKLAKVMTSVKMLKSLSCLLPRSQKLKRNNTNTTADKIPRQTIASFVCSHLGSGSNWTSFKIQANYCFAFGNFTLLDGRRTGDTTALVVDILFWSFPQHNKFGLPVKIKKLAAGQTWILIREVNQLNYSLLVHLYALV